LDSQVFAEISKYVFKMLKCIQWTK
jgi:hypothetical protein